MGCVQQVSGQVSRIWCIWCNFDYVAPHATRSLHWEYQELPVTKMNYQWIFHSLLRLATKVKTLQWEVQKHQAIAEEPSFNIIGSMKRMRTAINSATTLCPTRMTSTRPSAVFVTSPWRWTILENLSCFIMLGPISTRREWILSREVKCHNSKCVKFIEVSDNKSWMTLMRLWLVPFSLLF